MKITCVPFPGAATLSGGRTNSEISASWEMFDDDDYAWRAMQISWELFFHPKLVEEFPAVYASLSQHHPKARELEVITFLRRFKRNDRDEDLP